ncbi:hypothetical protein BG011_001362, partial [Mortierella polycephala]
MVESDGPSEAILTAINKTRREDDYKDLFRSVIGADFIEDDKEDEEEDTEGEEGDSPDYDYEDLMS